MAEAGGCGCLAGSTHPYPRLQAEAGSGTPRGNSFKLPSAPGVKGQRVPGTLLPLTFLPVKRNGRGVLVSGNSCSRRGSRSSRSPWQDVIVSRSTRSPSRE